MTDLSDTPEKFNLGHYFLLFLIVLSLFACWRMMAPYLDPIIIALLLAALLSPVNGWIQKKTGNRPNLAALLSCVLLTMVIILPVIVMLSVAVRQGVQSFNAIHAWIADGNLQRLAQTPLVGQVVALIKTYTPEQFLEGARLEETVMQSSSLAGKWLVSKGGYFIGNISMIAGKFLLMIFVFFFAVKDQQRLFDYLRHLIPMSTEHENILINKIKDVGRSAILGSLVTAAAQGAAGGIAFAICGLPGFFWGVMMAFASLVPVVGTALIWVPAVIYLVVSGSWGYGLFMAGWSIIVVGLLDNLLRPLFMRGGAGMNTILIFFSILGGLQYFGLTGLLYGPMIFGITLVLLYIYDLEFGVFLRQQDQR
ncbi:MAG: AI-2E family transporter [Desulfosudaceae bacterium]